MIAAIISVPPVLPFEEKAIPIPLPQKEAPSTHAINGWSCNKCISAVNFWISDRKKVSVNTAKIVLILNLKPNIFKASISKTALMRK